MSRASLVILVAAALLAVPATANAKTVRCNGHTYSLIDPSAFPGIGKLRALDLPRKTDGYAPRCLVAEAVAARVQAKWRHGITKPTVVRVGGARWDGGRWRVSSRLVTVHFGSGTSTYVAATARKVGARRERVTFRAFS